MPRLASPFTLSFDFRHSITNAAAARVLLAGKNDHTVEGLSHFQQEAVVSVEQEAGARVSRAGARDRKLLWG